jgi:hypothetical protein
MPTQHITPGIKMSQVEDGKQRVSRWKVCSAEHGYVYNITFTPRHRSFPLLRATRIPPNPCRHKHVKLLSDRVATDMEGRGLGLILRYYLGICLQGLRKTKINTMTIRFPIEIRTYTNEKRYRLRQLIQ